MKVRAKFPANGGEMYGVGYYDHRLCKGGEEFELSDPAHFSARWMEKIEPAEQPETTEEEKPSKRGGQLHKKFVPVDV